MSRGVPDVINTINLNYSREVLVCIKETLKLEIVVHTSQSGSVLCRPILGCVTRSGSEFDRSQDISTTRRYVLASQSL